MMRDEPTPKPFSFSKQHHIRTATEFNRVFKQRNKPMRFNGFTIHYCANEHNCPRLGLAISRKAAGNAVRRNKLRRLIKESFRMHIPQLSAIDFVVIGRPDINNYSARELNATLAKAWSKCMDGLNG